MGTGRGARVVVGVDGSPHGLAALRAAAAEAARRGVPLYAVRVDALAPASDFSSIDAAFADTLGGVPPGLDVHRVLAPPPIAGALAALADQPDDLLVVGTSGHGWWHALWSGSIARACVGKAHCPLLIVPDPPLARDLPHHRWRRPSHDLWRTFEHDTTARPG